MAKPLKRLDLLMKEVKDPHAQENFYRLKYYIDNLTTTGLIGPQGPQGPPGPQGVPGAGTELAEFANALKVTRVANVALTKGEAVYAISDTHVDLATGDSTIDKAVVFGFALSSVAMGENVDVLIMGVLEDSIFSVFTLNDPLFLDTAGGITDVMRTSGYHVIVAKSLGGDQVFVNIRDPLVIA